jgi:hypothetical protein
MRVTPRTVSVKLFLPLHHVCLAAVFLDQPVDVVQASAAALGTFDAEHVELAFKVTEDEKGPGAWIVPRPKSLYC